MKKFTETQLTSGEVVDLTGEVFTLIVHKNEYSERQINYIRCSFNVTKETDKTMEVEESHYIINKIQRTIFCSDEQFKAEFSDYMSKTARQVYTANKLADLKIQIGKTLLDCVNNGDTDSEEFALVRYIYLYDLVDIKVY